MIMLVKHIRVINKKIEFSHLICKSWISVFIFVHIYWIEFHETKKKRAILQDEVISIRQGENQMRRMEYTLHKSERGYITEKK